MRLAHEARVGAVVVLAFILMAAGYIFLRGIGFGADIYTIRLNGAATIAAGNDVRLQGIKVGTVQNVTLDSSTQKPLITIAIRHATPPYRLLRSYRYTVQSSALIGENFVDIRGEFVPNAPTYLANRESEIIPGTATPGIATLTDSAGVLAEDLGKTLKKFNVTLERVNKGILSYDNQQRLARTFENVTKLSDAASKSFGPKNQRQIERILNNTAQASQDGAAAVRQGQRRRAQLERVDAPDRWPAKSGRWFSAAGERHRRRKSWAVARTAGFVQRDGEKFDRPHRIAALHRR